MSDTAPTAMPATVTPPYTATQKALHWTIALAVLGLVPAGLTMTALGFEEPVVAITNTLYSWHKAIGFSVLWLMVLRLIIKTRRGAPDLPADIPGWQRIVANAVHGALYTLLVAVPLTGWAGATAYPALITVGGVHLPGLPLVPQSEALAERLFAVHGALAMTLAALVFAHIGGALQHLVLRKDGVFERMWLGR